MNKPYKDITFVDLLVGVSIVIIIASIIVPIAIGCSRNDQKLAYGTVKDKWYESGSTYYYKAGNVLVPRKFKTSGISRLATAMIPTHSA